MCPCAPALLRSEATHRYRSCSYVDTYARPCYAQSIRAQLCCPSVNAVAFDRHWPALPNLGQSIDTFCLHRQATLAHAHSTTQLRPLRYWGEKGYFRIVRGTNEGGIEDMVTGSPATAQWRKA